MTLNHNYDCSNEAVTGIAGNSFIGAVQNLTLIKLTITYQ